ncbi:hypothetical protein UCRPA7_3403 [Phaeoacremonium minimum UCRPA7]|uniref:Uncharacterized protein n=1 Tax=Phaeoacremonium minimum (strain UCR-PA7) TaxID=1286976 RepID=R8BP06_PHAM7|nr:hypothetical protein UCRPA7_3403 [Phaeoacremonium minimum UCRPA7]EOO01067.1 hypothetical protein UCRPA7_3403 [Phaeoacremonium minimum UCRPA7]
MKFEATILALAGLTAARELPLFTGRFTKREVPQEHSHEAILRAVNTALQLDNPLEIQDAVFALLGNAAAATGAPNVDNLDCLQQIVADQAFTNAKAAGDITAQANAILFRALERNTGKVGLESVLCNETAVNAEIAAITQHQDPASASASGNKDIALAVAVQLASIGADPNLAIQSGTFAPGDLNDATAAGNTCDDPDDAVGCIISQNLLVPDVTEDEIAAAVAGVSTGVAAGNAASNATAQPASSSAASADNAEAATGTNVNAFTGNLGSAPVPVVSSAGDRPFSVEGSTFVNVGAAIQRACAVQNNACSNAANSGQIDASVGDCNAQEQACRAASGVAKRALRKFRIRQNVDFGSCANPAIKFADNLDGRKEASFAPVDEATFTHGSALNIKVISDFICGQLASKCDASDATVADCQAASTAAQAQQGQAAADAFNSALGV